MSYTNLDYDFIPMDLDTLCNEIDKYFEEIDTPSPSSISSSAAVNAPSSETPPSSTASSTAITSSTFTATPRQQPELEHLPDFIYKLLNEASHLERQQILQAQSLINHIPPDLQYDVNIKLLAMLFGDKIIGSSSLEGSDPIENIKFILAILSAASILPAENKQPLIQEFQDLNSIGHKIRQVKTETDVHDLAAYLKQKLLALSPESRLLIPGGWQTTTGGHFMLYEILKKKDNLYVLNVYNTGAGINYHSHSQINEKEYLNPLVSVNNIPVERITSLHFLLIMIAVKTPAFTGKGAHQIEASDIYQKLLPLLGSEVVINNSAELVTAQFSGTCSSKAIIAYLKNRLPSHFFAELLYQLKFWSLANFISQKNSCNTISEANLIKKASHGLANLARKIYLKAELNQGKLDLRETERLLQLSTLCQKALDITENYTIPPPDPLKPGDIVSTFSLDVLDKIDNIPAKTKIKPTSSEIPQSTSNTSKGSVVTSSAYTVPPYQLNGHPCPFFANWLSYFKTLLSTDHSLIAFHHLDILLDNLPVTLDFSCCTPTDKEKLFDTLHNLASEYFSFFMQNTSANRFSCNANMWHLFMITSSLWKEITSQRMPSLGLENYGFNFLIPSYEPNIGMYSEVACTDLKAQRKNLILRTTANQLNLSKQAFLFDTIFQHIRELKFKVCEENIHNYTDFSVIKAFLQSPYFKGKISSSNFLHDLLQHYQQARPRGLPRNYYDLRTLYLSCLASNEFTRQITHHIPSFKIQLMGLENDEDIKNNKTYELQYLRTKPKITAKFTTNSDVNAYSASQNYWLSEAYPFFTSSKFIHHIISTNLSNTQNTIRSTPKALLKPSHLHFPQNGFTSTSIYTFSWNQSLLQTAPKMFEDELTESEFASISKYEMNRLSDIYYADTDKLYLALNYYRDNTHLLEKNTHWHFLAFLFYQFYSLETNIADNPKLTHLINAFFKKILTTYKIPEPTHYPLVLALFKMGFDYLFYFQDLDLYHFLKSEAIRQYQSIAQGNISDAHSEFKIHFSDSVLKALSLAPDLSYEEAALAIAVIMKKSDVSNSQQWEKSTSPILNKLSHLLKNPSIRQAILNSVPEIQQNIDTSQNPHWDVLKDTSYTYICQGWKLNIFLGILSHPERSTLKVLLNQSICKHPSHGEVPLHKLLGNAYHELTFRNGMWSNSQKTLRIFTNNSSCTVQQFILNEWHEFCFMSDGLRDACLNIPCCFDAPKQKSKIKKATPNDTTTFQYPIKWFKPVSSANHLLYGLNSKDEVLYLLKKNKSSWSLETLDSGLIYASISKGALPSPLEAIGHFPLFLLNQMYLWLNPKSKEIEKIEFRNASGSENILVIAKEKGLYAIKDFEGLTIAPSSSKSPFHTLPPILQVDHPNGKKYVIIPQTEVSIVNKGVQQDPFRLQQSFNLNELKNNDVYGIIPFEDTSKTANPSFFLYEFNPNSTELTTTDLTSEIFLSYLYFTDQNYEKAFELLKRCKQRTPYSDQQLDLFSACLAYYEANHTDISNPLQAAYLLHIRFYMLHSQEFRLKQNSHNKQSVRFFNKLDTILIDYYQFLNAIPDNFRLSFEVEKCLLELAISESTNNTTLPQYNLPSIQQKPKNNKIRLQHILRSIQQKNYTAHHLAWGVFSHTGANDDISFGKKIAHSPCTPFQKNRSSDIIEFDNFNFKNTLEKLRGLPLDYLINKPLKQFDDYDAMALWMGALSDNAEDAIFAKARIAFLKILKTKKKIFFKYNEFLILANQTTDAFKGYLQTQGIHIDWNQPQGDVPQILIKAWPDFYKNVWASRIFQNTTKYGQDTSQRIIHRNLKSNRSAAQHIGVKADLLKAYDVNVLSAYSDLESERKKLSLDFLNATPFSDSSKLLSLDTHSPAHKLLHDLPLAKKLYDDYSQTACIQGLKWSLKISEHRSPEKTLRQFLKELQAKKDMRAQAAAALKQIIEKEANATPLDHGQEMTIARLQEALEKKIDVFSYQKSSITLEKLVALILSKSWYDLQNLNPFLSSQDTDTLYFKTMHWLILETEIETYARVEREIADLLQNISEEANLDASSSLELIGTSLNTQRHYNIWEQPQFLAFEYLAKLVLRKQQVEKITHFMSATQSHQIMKLMMGEGKTKVILPLLSKLLADGNRLPLIIAPHSLYEEYLKDLKAISELSLSQNVFTFTFNRSSSSKPNDTSLILNMLRKALQERGVVILTAETIRALFLKYQELLLLEEEAAKQPQASLGDMPNRRFILGEIINTFRTQCCALMDEGHLALKSLTEMNFTLISNEPLNEHEIRILLKIYQQLIANGFDFAQPLQLDVAQEESCNFRQLREELIHGLYPQREEAGIRAYLQGNDPNFLAQIRARNTGLAEELALVKEQLWKLLPFTLSKSLNHRYGRNTHNLDVEYAVPYVGAQKPSPLSEFGHKYVVINNTIQMLIQEGLNEFQFKKWILKLKKRWVNIMVNGSEEEANAFQAKFLGHLSLQKLNLNDPVMLKDAFIKLSKSQTIIFDYLENLLLPDMQFHTKKLNSNEQDLGDFLFPNVLALSGTPYNASTYPMGFQKKLSMEPVSSTSTDFTDEEVRLVFTLSQTQNQTLHTVDIESAMSALDTLRNAHKKNPNLSAFIDLGAYFKDYTNLQSAKMILETLPNIDAVVFFNDSNNKIFHIKRDCAQPEPYVQGQIPLKRLFTFFDNIHTFAADITLHEKAHAIVSFNQDVCLYELLQSVKRMRKLERSQSVSYLITHSIENKIKSLIGDGHCQPGALYLYAILNEAKVLGKEIELSTMHQLKHIIKKSYLHNQLLSNMNLGAASKVLVESDKFTPSGHFSKKIAPRIYFENYCKALEPLINSTNPPHAKWKEIISYAEKLLPKEMDSEGESNLNREIEKQEERKVEIFVDKSSRFEPCMEEFWNLDSLYQPLVHYDILPTLNQPSQQIITYNLNQFISLIDNKPSQIFDNAIYISKNFAKTAQLQPPNWEIPLKPVDYFVCLLFSQDPNTFFAFYLVISLHEMHQLKQHFMHPNFILSKASGRPYISLFSIQGELIAGDDILDPNTSEFKTALVQLKYFDGRERFSKEEEPLIRNWVQGQESAIIDLFSKLHQNREKNDDYGDGGLFKISNESLDIQKQLLMSSLQGPIGLEKHPPAISKAQKRPYMYISKQKEDGQDGMDVDVAPDSKAKRQKT